MLCARATRTKKTVAAIVLLCMLVVALLSEVFLFAHAGHEHDAGSTGADCAICAWIHSSKNQRKQIHAVVGVSWLWFAAATTPLALRLAVVSFACFNTLVLLKVRMDS